VSEQRGAGHNATMLATIITFLLTKKKIFHLKEDLCYLLYYTELSKVDAEIIALPFDCFYMNGFDCLNFKTEHGQYGINAVYIKGIKLDSATQQLVYDKQKDNLMPNVRPSDLLFSLNFLFCAENFTEKGEEDEFSVTFPLTKGDVLEQVDYFFDHFGKNYFTEYNINLLRTMVKFEINCILYINSDEALMQKIIPENSSRQKISRNIRKNSNKRRSSHLHYYHVGHSIVIDNKDKEVYKSELSNDTRKQRLTLSWIVRGHWQGYWVKETKDGDVIKYFDEEKKKHLIKKLKRPFIKGKELGEMVNKDYIVR
jgi:hypothetical protein